MKLSYLLKYISIVENYTHPTSVITGQTRKLKIADNITSLSSDPEQLLPLKSDWFDPKQKYFFCAKNIDDEKQKLLDWRQAVSVFMTLAEENLL